MVLLVETEGEIMSDNAVAKNEGVADTAEATATGKAEVKSVAKPDMRAFDFSIDKCMKACERLFRSAGMEWTGFVALKDEAADACKVLSYIRWRWVDCGDEDSAKAVKECCELLDLDRLMIYGWLERDEGFSGAWDFLERVRRKMRASDIEKVLTERAINGWDETKEWLDPRTKDKNMTTTRKFDNRLGLMLMQSGNEAYIKDGEKPVGVSWPAWKAMKEKESGKGDPSLPSVTLCGTRDAAKRELDKRIASGK